MRSRYWVVVPALLVLLFFDDPLYAQPTGDWQQRVHYEMDITLQADRHQMRGQQTLQYENHSPDTLSRIYYHLYFNAFQPHSMMAERNRVLPDPDSRIVPRIFELGPDEIGYHRIKTLEQNGTPVEYSVFDTVLEVKLVEPIPPGGRTVLDMSFVSQVPLQTRRSGRDNLEGIDYSMSQWYPKVANYDQRGWHADPYVGREFYAPFGTFDVRITLPADYVIGSTGVLQNPEEIGHGYADEDPRLDTDSLTWHFRAEDVHDFAWAADPDFRHDVLDFGDGKKMHLLYQSDVSDVWQHLHEWGPEIMEFFDRNYGAYAYPQMTVAQAGDGGMEYPMITFITGRRPPPSLLGVTAHEVAHMWFYGMMGTNEADYAWMDEGFTGYATTEVTSHINGNPDPSHASSHLAVLQAKHFGLFERLNTPSDWFDTNFGYSIAAYTGGEMIVDLLGYVISDSLRDAFLLEYHDRFALRHPDPYDVEKVAEDVSGMRLDWFFEEFGNTTWDLDYGVGGLQSEQSGGAWTSTVTLKRNARSVLPVDVRLTLADGTHQWVHVPLGIGQGHKPVPDDWTVLEPWAWTVPTYHAELTTRERVVHAEIDPMLRTPERTRLNNASSLPLDVTFLQAPVQSWRAYQVGWRPLLQYAHNWGVAGGIQFRGRYLFDRYASKATIKLWPDVLLSGGADPGVNSESPLTDPIRQRSTVDGIDFDLSVSNTFSAGPLVQWTLRSRKHIGILQNDASASILLDPAQILEDRQQRVTVGIRHQHRTTDRAFFNHVSEGFLPEAIVSAYARLSLTGPLSRFEAAAETGGELRGRGNARSANRAWIDLARGLPLGPFTGSIRVMGGVGDQQLARHKQFRLGSATYEDRWADAGYRSIAGAFSDPLTDAHLVAFDAPGPVAYLRHASSLTDEVTGTFGRSHMAALSMRVLTPRLNGHSLLRPFRAELFFGAGQGWNGGLVTDFHPEDILMDAGIGLRYDLSRLSAIDRWAAQSDVLSGLTLTARFPVWASDPERSDAEDPIALRWLLGMEFSDLPWL